MKNMWVIVGGLLGGTGFLFAATYFYQTLLVTFTRLDELAHAGVPAVWAVALLWQVARTAALEAKGTRKNDDADKRDGK